MRYVDHPFEKDPHTHPCSHYAWDKNIYLFFSCHGKRKMMLMRFIRRRFMSCAREEYIFKTFSIKPCFVWPSCGCWINLFLMPHRKPPLKWWLNRDYYYSRAIRFCGRSSMKVFMCCWNSFYGPCSNFLMMFNDNVNIYALLICFLFPQAYPWKPISFNFIWQKRQGRLLQISKASKGSSLLRRSLSLLHSTTMLWSQTTSFLQLLSHLFIWISS